MANSTPPIISGHKSAEVNKAVGKQYWDSTNAWSSPIGAPGKVQIDFGPVPVAEAEFTVTDANVSMGSTIVGSVAYEAPDGKDLDEVEMDAIDLKFGAGAGYLTIRARGLEGYLADKFVINYLVAGA